MNVGAILYNASLPQRPEYPTCIYSGPWTETEKSLFKELGLDKHIPELDTPTFNTWRFSKVVHTDETVSFSAWRATWEFGGIHGKTAAEMFTKVADYYEKNR